MQDGAAHAATRSPIIRALRETLFTALISLGLFLPLIGFSTVQNIRNELVLETRWPLLFTIVAIIAGLRFLQVAAITPLLADRARRPLTGFRFTLPAALARWTTPVVLVFAVIYPLLGILIMGPGAGKWIDNFGVQIFIYVLLGWGLNIVVGLAGLLDLGYVAFFAVGAYTCALLGLHLDLSFWMLLPLAGVLAAFWGILLGFPVLRLRGDYLAVVTLAFGEIIRLVLVNWVPVTKGYAGIGSLPRPTLFGIPFDSSPDGFAARFGLSFSPLHRLLYLYYIMLG